MDNTVEVLEKRIAELEKQLKNLSSVQKPAINPEDMEIFKKVGSQLGYDIIDECGVNECKPIVILKGSQWFQNNNPWIQWIPYRFCYECQCGPCNFGDFRNFGGSGLERFNIMGR